MTGVVCMDGRVMKKDAREGTTAASVLSRKSFTAGRRSPERSVSPKWLATTPRWLNPPEPHLDRAEVEALVNEGQVAGH